jgi:hypothetical protein
VTKQEIEQAVQPSEETVAEAKGDNKDKKSRKGDKMLAAVKGIAKGGVGAALGGDRIKAKAGSKDAKARLGAVKIGRTGWSGPTSFPARFQGKKGHVFITTTALSWTAASEDVDPVWTVEIADIHVSCASKHAALTSILQTNT